LEGDVFSSERFGFLVIRVRLDPTVKIRSRRITRIHVFHLLDFLLGFFFSREIFSSFRVHWIGNICPLQFGKKDSTLVGKNNFNNFRKIIEIITLSWFK